MSESATEQEKPQEKPKEKITYVGTVANLIEKKWGWYAVEIAQPGKTWTIKADTKLEHLIQKAREARDSGAVATFIVEEWDSDNISEKSGKPFRERRLSAVNDGGKDETAAAVQDTAQRRMSGGVKFNTGGGNDTMTKEEWARKDSAIHMMAAIKSAADALKHTLPSEPSQADLQTYVERVKFLSYNWWQRADAVRKGDESDVPFLNESDDSLPF